MISLADVVLPWKFMQKLDFIVSKHNKWRSEKHPGNNQTRVCSVKTRKERRSAILLCFSQLWEMGYQFVTPTSLGDRHVAVLVKRWNEEGVSLTTMHTRISFLRNFACWIGKRGMVRQLGYYLPDRDVRRKTAAQKNLAWLANGVDPKVVINNARELDERLGVMLALQHAFGLRMKEAIEMRPEFSRNEDESMLEIYRGTKGGRLRGVPLDSDYKQEVFEWALRVAAGNKSGRVRWPDLTWAQARRRYYYLLAEKMGINKREKGVSSHGLRHGFSQCKYREIAGMPTPIEGADPEQVDSARHRAANIAVAKQLGHGRANVTAAYYGSHGHSLRMHKKPGDSPA